MLDLNTIQFWLKNKGILRKPKQNSYSTVKWIVATKKINFNTYDIHITAMVKYPYYIPSQQSSEEGPLPTIIVFTPNPNVVLKGTPIEQGNLKEQWCSSYNVPIWYYKTAVDFVQRIQLPNSVMKLKFEGKVFYTTCTENKCLPSEEFHFQVEI